MQNRDEVIRQCTIAIQNHASGLSAALRELLDDKPGAIQTLRDNLVAQAGGFEPTAHDGATYVARVAAAKAALEAWDGRPEEKTADQCMVDVKVGTRTLRIPCDIARALHIHSTNSDVNVYLAQAIHDRRTMVRDTHEAIALHALALYLPQRDKLKLEEAKQCSAKLAYQAAEQHKTAEAIKAKHNKD